MGSIQLRFALEEYSTPADKGTFPLSAAAFLVDCEKQPGHLDITFPSLVGSLKEH